MLCSLGELGLTVHDFPYAIEDGIFIIEEDCQVGQDICSAIGLNDTSVEFEITPNRPDCLSVIGLGSRGFGGITVPLKEHAPHVNRSNDGDAAGSIFTKLPSVTVQNPHLCPAVCGQDG